MKKVLAVMPLVLCVNAAMANEINHDSKFYGELGVAAGKMHGTDLDVTAYHADVGVKGLIKYDLIQVHYFGELKYQTQANQLDIDPLTISDSKVAIQTDYGTAVLAGHTKSGIYADLYSPVNIHEVSTGSPYSHDQLFQQAKYTKGAVGYASPRWNGLQFKTAIITANNDNDENLDVLRLSALYTKGNLKIAGNLAKIAAKQVAQEDDYDRWSIMGQYKFDNFEIAGLVEINENSPAGDNQVYVAAVKYFIDNIEVRLSHQYRLWEDADPITHIKPDANQLTTAGLHYHFSDNFGVFVEGSMYSDPIVKSNYISDDNINLGFKVRY
ncbi:porin [Shewanella intestini]|uniref:Porin n=1 Tax=Shewanella intestini TaxID=2017544 RepID=A0ABS5I4B8_9GAMM|nr:MULTISPECIES: porin [Shewanella]MBR9728150.1 porin [Shewanella intestini]MRG36621.1 porin [Shewanella sp. XMDDZSB0408]